MSLLGVHDGLQRDDGIVFLFDFVEKVTRLIADYGVAVNSSSSSSSNTTSTTESSSCSTTTNSQQYSAAAKLSLKSYVCKTKTILGANHVC